MTAPIVIGRDHLDAGSVASPYRETEAMADGSDAIADWPLLNALVNTASGATWVSIHHGGGVGIGRSIHAGQVSVADGTALAAEKLARVLANDPAMGVLRHVDAGYPEARRPPGGGPAGTDGRGREALTRARARDPAPPGRSVARESHVQDVSRPERGFRQPRGHGGGRLRPDVGRPRAASGGIPAPAATGASPGPREDADLREWFAGRGRRARARRRRRPGRQPLGLVGRPRRAPPTAPARVSSSARTWTPCPTAAPSTARSAWSRRSPRSTRCAHRGFTPARPLGVALFGDEEGARFGVACAGSRLLTGALTADRARGADRRATG